MDEWTSELDPVAWTPLDDDAGPAQPLSAAAADAVARAVVARVSAASAFTPLGDAPGPAVPLSSGQAEAMARAVVRRARTARRLPALGAWQWAAAAVVSLGVVGGAFAAVRTYLSPPASPAVQAPTAAASAPPPRRRVRTMQLPTVAIEGRVPPAEPPASAPADADVPQVARAAAPAPAGDLLAQANRLRASGAFRQAERRYSAIAQRRDTPDAAYVATVAAAALRLEHTGQVQAALAMYRRALRMRPQGALAHAARLGIADCYRALDKPDLEARALERVLEHGPDPLTRGKAQSRLRGLRGRTRE